ncbi:hypothetical protein NQ318_002408 [Aromia moschata]|uniref:Nuclear envelope membrane protein n=1 Tax=Aromia moschata TaxID=1265417 RepID=A0AAV8YFI2_9CUCU|nr:hypothetical protein NQ318_002408 [Aromia moschata]
MGIKQVILNFAKISLCSFGLIITFYMVMDFTYFLSIPAIKGVHYINRTNDPWLNTSWALLANMALLSLFILQHSLLASNEIKNAFNAYSLQVIYRSLYVITTAGILLFLTRHWKSTPDVILWEMNLNYKPIFWIYASIHTVAWLIIYIGNICTDVTELLGIKQVYYSVVNLPDPNLRKSLQLQRLTNHMRHPSFLAFVLIFWLYPVMRAKLMCPVCAKKLPPIWCVLYMLRYLDRLLLAVILTAYMYIAWNTDERDYYYHKSQYERKYHELERLNRYSY